MNTLFFLVGIDWTLPLDNPVLKFLILLIIILFAPILLNKIKVPHLLGLIIAGALIGPNGFHLMNRDSSIVLYGSVGLLYIMFLAGLEIDIADFKKNSAKSLVFGLLTFVIPMTLGILAGIYILEFNIMTSVLLASMFASHTLIIYPLISKMGLSKNLAVNITVGGTIITDTLALLVLAVIVGMSTGEVNNEFWIRLSISILAFGLFVIFIFPIISRWYFKKFDDSVSQYIFVLAMVFFGAFLAELAGIEGIIGAFIAGLALNRLIPHTSPLMNRIEFVGNAIFIPIFLIGVGMLIDYRVFIGDLETLKVAAVMIVVATFSKFLAAWLTQKTFNFTADERRLIFGLSNAQAAATLAAVLVGYNVILGLNDLGEPIRLLNESILNGTVLMILFTCTIASFVGQKGAKNLALLESTENNDEQDDFDETERILIPINNMEITEEMVNLTVTIKSPKNKSGLYALNVIDEINGSNKEKYANKLLKLAAVTASATDNQVNEIIRYDINTVNGISSIVKEKRITDLILGLSTKKGISESFLGNLTEGILSRCNTTSLIYKPAQPFGTIKRHLIVVPENAENEIGFPFWLSKVWNIAKNSGAKLVFFGTESTISIIKDINIKLPIEADFNDFTDWEDFLILSRDIKLDDNLIIIMSRKERPSYHSSMLKIPNYLNKYFKDNSYILVYPMQSGVADHNPIDLKNPTLLEPLEKLDQIRQTIFKLLKKK